MGDDCMTEVVLADCCTGGNLRTVQLGQVKELYWRLL